MKAIIFGAAGQDGYYLSKLLKEKGLVVIGVSRSGDFLKTDITDFEQVEKLLKEEKPDYIFHLAADSTTNHAVVFQNHETIVAGSLNILESVRKNKLVAKVFIAGSGLQFLNNNRPIKETDPFEPRNMYAVSRIQSVYTARYYHSVGVKVYIGYLFNHDSPMRSESHMTKKIAEAAKRIGKGCMEKIQIGDITAIKEYGFAGDIVKGIWTLVNQDRISEANISTGKGYAIEDWLQVCFSVVNMNWRDYVIPDPEFKPDYKQLVSDPALIYSLGWRPDTDINTLAKLMMQ